MKWSIVVALLCLLTSEVVEVNSITQVASAPTLSSKHMVDGLGRTPRVKRSPFIMAFQVTRPPGMFQMSLRRPYIFNMMSNLTRSLFNTNFTDMLRKGFVRSSATVENHQDEVQSKQEDIEIYD